MCARCICCRASSGVVVTLVVARHRLLLRLRLCQRPERARGGEGGPSLVVVRARGEGDARDSVHQQGRARIHHGPGGCACCAIGSRHAPTKARGCTGGTAQRRRGRAGWDSSYYTRVVIMILRPGPHGWGRESEKSGDSHTHLLTLCPAAVPILAAVLRMIRTRDGLPLGQRESGRGHGHGTSTDRVVGVHTGP